MNDESRFEDLMKKYDWYAEMSDDTRKWDAQQDMERELKSIAKNIGAEDVAIIYAVYRTDKILGTGEYKKGGETAGVRLFLHEFGIELPWKNRINKVLGGHLS